MLLKKFWWPWTMYLFFPFLASAGGGVLAYFLGYFIGILLAGPADIMGYAVATWAALWFYSGTLWYVLETARFSAQAMTVHTLPESKQVYITGDPTSGEGAYHTRVVERASLDAFKRAAPEMERGYNLTFRNMAGILSSKEMKFRDDWLRDGWVVLNDGQWVLTEKGRDIFQARTPTHQVRGLLEKR